MCVLFDHDLYICEIISQDVCEVVFFVMGCFAAKPILTYVVTCTSKRNWFLLVFIKNNLNINPLNLANKSSKTFSREVFVVVKKLAKHDFVYQQRNV